MGGRGRSVIKAKLPPVWLLGLANLPFGGSGAIALITVPQLLAARGVPQPTIATVTTFALIPTFAGFLLSPVLDIRFSRRTYAIAFALLTAVAGFFALTSLGDIGALETWLFLCVFASVLFSAALGGWVGTLVDRDADNGLGAWLAVGNIGGFGLTAIAAIWLVRTLPFDLGAAVLCAAILLPIGIFAWLPAPPPDRKLAGESFAEFFRDLKVLVRRPAVVGTLILFVPPAASFALTNQLGGVGGEYGASERLVSIIAGIGVTIAGVIGSLVVPAIARRVAPRALYLAIGATGALFTLTLLALPRTPTVFAVALIGENLFQAAAFSVQYAIVLRTLGKDNPLAASQFAFLIAAQALPITYMQWIDGRAYAAGGLSTTFTVDAALGLAACALLAVFVRRGRLTPVVA